LHAVLETFGDVKNAIFHIPLVFHARAEGYRRNILINQSIIFNAGKTHKNTYYENKKALRETQTLRAGCSKAGCGTAKI